MVLHVSCRRQHAMLQQGAPCAYATPTVHDAVRLTVGLKISSFTPTTETAEPKWRVHVRRVAKIVSVPRTGLTLASHQHEIAYCFNVKTR